MKNLLLYFLILLPISAFSQNSQLSGAWILTSIRYDNTLLESDYPEPGPYRWTSPNTHWVFKDNKCYEINYPCCLLNEKTVSIKEGTLYLKATDRSVEMFGFDFRNDSLILTGQLPDQSVYYFIKDTIPLKELNKFTTGYVNPVCLYGDWEIPTGEVSVPFDAINVWYPWKLPEKIHIDEKNLHHYWANNRIYLEVDGVKRPFRVKKVSLDDENMTLIPESWVEEYIKKFNLSAYEVESVWLRKPEEY
jgi:hypothetical protein